jgi:hypothetical protein
MHPVIWFFFFLLIHFILEISSSFIDLRRNKYPLNKFWISEYMWKAVDTYTSFWHQLMYTVWLFCTLFPMMSYTDVTSIAFHCEISYEIPIKNMIKEFPFSYKEYCYAMSTM